MIYALIAFGILAVVGALVATARRSGKKEAENEVLAKTTQVQAKQLDIAAAPDDSPIDSLKWLRGDDDK